MSSEMNNRCPFISILIPNARNELAFYNWKSSCQCEPELTSKLRLSFKMYIWKIRKCFIYKHLNLTYLVNAPVSELVYGRRKLISVLQNIHIFFLYLFRPQFIANVLNNVLSWKNYYRYQSKPGYSSALTAINYSKNIKLANCKKNILIIFSHGLDHANFE